MEIIRLILGLFGWLFMTLNASILMGKHNLNVIKRNFWITNYLTVLSFIFSGISLLFGKILYDQYDILSLIVVIVDLIPTIIIIKERVKNGKNNEKTINLNEGYTIITDEEKRKNPNLKNFRELIKIMHGNKEYLVAFDSEVPKNKKNVSIVIEEHNENNFKYYLCTRILNNEIQKKDYWILTFKTYVILVAAYGQVIVSKLLLSKEIVKDEKVLSFLFIPIGYAIFTNGVNLTENRDTSFNKVFYYIFLIFKFILIIELLFLPFI